jgi:membrane protein
VQLVHRTAQRVGNHDHTKAAVYRTEDRRKNANICFAARDDNGVDVVALALALSLVYRFGPSRRTAQWKWLTLGSVTAAALWMIASLLFSWYAANFGSFNRTYGSLGAVIGFMVWIWISIIVVLLGVEIDAELEHVLTDERG